MAMICTVRSNVGPAWSMQSGSDDCIHDSTNGQVRPFSFWLKMAVFVCVLRDREIAKAALIRMKGGIVWELRSLDRCGSAVENFGAMKVLRCSAKTSGLVEVSDGGGNNEEG